MFCYENKIYYHCTQEKTSTFHQNLTKQIKRIKNLIFPTKIFPFFAISHRYTLLLSIFFGFDLNLFVLLQKKNYHYLYKFKIKRIRIKRTRKSFINKLYRVDFTNLQIYQKKINQMKKARVVVIIFI